MLLDPQALLGTGEYWVDVTETRLLKLSHVKFLMPIKL